MRRRYAPRLPPPLSPLRGAGQATCAPLPRRHCRRCAAMGKPIQAALVKKVCLSLVGGSVLVVFFSVAAGSPLGRGGVSILLRKRALLRTSILWVDNDLIILILFEALMLQPEHG